MSRREINKYIGQNCARSWIYLRDYIGMDGQQHIQRKFILIASCMYATRFASFSGHRQTCQYKNHLKEGKVK